RLIGSTKFGRLIAGPSAPGKFRTARARGARSTIRTCLRPFGRPKGARLLDNASARIVPGARVGLVGRNGSGKTTLFNVIAGDLSAEQGSVDLPPRWR